MNTGKYKVISLFSGAMGLDVGLEQTGRFDVVACVELEKAFCDTIRANVDAGNLSPSLKVFETDIRALDPQHVLDVLGLKPGDIDLIVGGPPCQSFSTAGSRGTVQDPRGTLLWQYLSFIKSMAPKFFLMENVRGLMSAAIKHRPIADRPDRGGLPLTPEEEPGSVIRLFSDDLQRIASHPYHMDCFLVNAVNYGAPQLRERAIFIGNRYNAVVDFPDPTHGPAGQDTSDDLPLFGARVADRMPWATLGDAIRDLNDDNSPVMDFSPRKKRYLGMVPPGSNWRSLPENLQKESMGKAWYAKGGRSGWWRRLSMELPCPTLVTMPNHASTSLCHPNEVRALSVREYAAIQEFPLNWRICGKTAEQYAQIGNAVPVRLGKVAGEIVAAKMDALQQRQWEPFEDSPEAYRTVYIQAHVRTRRWFKDGETHVWEEGKENGKHRYSNPKTKRKVSNMAE